MLKLALYATLSSHEGRAQFSDQLFGSVCLITPAFTIIKASVESALIAS